MLPHAPNNLKVYIVLETRNFCHSYVVIVRKCVNINLNSQSKRSLRTGEFHYPDLITKTSQRIAENLPMYISYFLVATRWTRGWWRHKPIARIPSHNSDGFKCNFKVFSFLTFMWVIHTASGRTCVEFNYKRHLYGLWGEIVALKTDYERIYEDKSVSFSGVIQLSPGNNEGQ